jgi:hypothetical protein
VEQRRRTTTSTIDDQRQQAVLLTITCILIVTKLIVVFSSDFIEHHLSTNRSRLYSMRNQARDCLSKRHLKFIVEDE